MAKVKIEGNASGTGTFTIAAPNSNTDRTLTLPDAAGELLTTTGDGSGLTGISVGGRLVASTYYTFGTAAFSETSWTDQIGQAHSVNSETTRMIVTMQNYSNTNDGGTWTYAYFRFRFVDSGSTETISNQVIHGQNGSGAGDLLGAQFCQLHITNPASGAGNFYLQGYKSSTTGGGYGRYYSPTLIVMEYAL